MNQPTFSKDEAAAALKRIFRPGDVFEIRALEAQTGTYNRPHTVSGYFDYDHIDAAAALIDREIRFARGIYYTPNPVEPALLARAANRFRDMGQRDPSTADKDIPRRRWLLIDCDAIRPSGISSSENAQKTAPTARVLTHSPRTRIIAPLSARENRRRRTASVRRNRCSPSSAPIPR